MALSNFTVPSGNISLSSKKLDFTYSTLSGFTSHL